MENSTTILTNPIRPAGNAAALTVLVVGFIAAFGAGKLPPVLPQVQSELDISLVQAGVLVSCFQLAGALMGMLAGALADRFGQKNLMMLGMLALAVGSATGAMSDTALLLLVSRAIESIGFVLAVLPGPALLRTAVSENHLSRWLGLWGAYMPFGFGLALIVTPAIGADFGWRAGWLVHMVLALLAIGLLRKLVPDPVRVASGGGGKAPFMTLMVTTLRSAGPWLCAAVFACYAGAYLSIVAFLPTIYQQGGLSPQIAGWLTALVAAINIMGNVGSGLLINRNVKAHLLIVFAAIYLVVGSWLTYAADIGATGAYIAVASVSAVMGLIPGSLFYLCNRYAPGPSTVSTSVGLMQQGSAVGQLFIPVWVASIAAHTGGWENTWWVIGVCALIIVLMAALLHGQEEKLAQRQ